MDVLKVIDRANKIFEIALRMANGNPSVVNRIAAIGLHTNGYAEPGYNAELIATGNWNEIDQYDAATKSRILISDLPKRIEKLFSQMGIACEWSDEWTTCDDCGKLVRTQPDSYSWTPSFCTVDCSEICIDCISEEPDYYFETLEGTAEKVNAFRTLNPANYEYVRIDKTYDGKDNARIVAKELEKKGISRYLFSLDEKTQFDIKYSAFVHISEFHLVNPQPVFEAELAVSVQHNCCELCGGTGVRNMVIYDRVCECKLK